MFSEKEKQALLPIVSTKVIEKGERCLQIIIEPEAKTYILNKAADPVVSIELVERPLGI